MKLFVVALAGGIVAFMPLSREVVSAASPSGPMLTNLASFDGRRLLLAVGTARGAASLWDVETGTRIQEFVGHTEDVHSVALSPDGRQVLTGGGHTAMVVPSTDNSVRLWDVASGRELRRFDGSTYPAWAGPVFEVAFSENGREVLGVGGGRGLAVWEAETARLLFQHPSASARREDSLRMGLVMTRGGGGEPGQDVGLPVRQDAGPDRRLQSDLSRAGGVPTEERLLSRQDGRSVPGTRRPGGSCGPTVATPTPFGMPCSLPMGSAWSVPRRTVRCASGTARRASCSANSAMKVWSSAR